MALNFNIPMGPFPGDPFSEMIEGGQNRNQLLRMQLENQYYGPSQMADIASKSTYARYLPAQIAQNFLADPAIRHSLRKEQLGALLGQIQNSLLNPPSIESLVPGMMQPGAPQSNILGNIGRGIANIFGSGQQQPQLQDPSAAVSNEIPGQAFSTPLPPRKPINALNLPTTKEQALDMSAQDWDNLSQGIQLGDPTETQQNIEPVYEPQQPVTSDFVVQEDVDVATPGPRTPGARLARKLGIEGTESGLDYVAGSDANKEALKQNLIDQNKTEEALRKAGLEKEAEKLSASNDLINYADQGLYWYDKAKAKGPTLGIFPSKLPVVSSIGDWQPEQMVDKFGSDETKATISSQENNPQLNKAELDFLKLGVRSRNMSPGTYKTLTEQIRSLGEKGVENVKFNHEFYRLNPNGTESEKLALWNLYRKKFPNYDWKTSTAYPENNDKWVYFITPRALSQYRKYGTVSLPKEFEEEKYSGAQGQLDKQIAKRIERELNLEQQQINKKTLDTDVSKRQPSNVGYTQEDLEYTAKQHGISVQEVIKRLNARGQ